MKHWIGAFWYLWCKYFGHNMYEASRTFEEVCGDRVKKRWEYCVRCDEKINEVEIFRLTKQEMEAQDDEEYARFNQGGAYNLSKERRKHYGI